jgi:hypothetical protein
MLLSYERAKPVSRSVCCERITDCGAGVAVGVRTGCVQGVYMATADAGRRGVMESRGSVMAPSFQLVA